MSSLFDDAIDRRNTNSIKYDFAAERGMPEDTLPLWVADMDFKAPPDVLKVLSEVVDHGIFGYSDSRQPYLDVLHRWFRTRFNWDFEDDWLVKTPGVVYAIATAVRALTEPGDAVLIQQPVYYPFSSIIKVNKRRLIVNELVYSDDGYRIDAADFERQIVENQVRLFIFCSPHNPVGRVWTSQEIDTIGRICLRHHVKIISDEIHADFVYSGHAHHILTQVLPELASQTILCTAPSKSFNLAGLQAANIFIPSPTLKRAFKAEMNRSGYSQLNTMGLAACQAAYEYGGKWLDELLVYLEGNLDFLEQFLQTRLPQIRLVRPQGTYLAWLDFRGLFENEQQRKQFMANEARLWLDEGTMFGPQGAGFERLNFACPRHVLKQALDQLEQAWQARF